jgi:hypothetical protein
MAIHVDHYLTISQLPADCISDCSASGDVTAAVQYWREELEFSVDRTRALRCLQGYGAWEAEELAEMPDSDLADKVLWLACGDFNEFITHAEAAGIDPFGERPDGFDPNSGSDLFCLE